MRIVLLGSGEAFDETLGNTSALVISDSVVLIDAIYISHGHADHYFGLPALLTRMWEEGRKKPLTLVSQEQVLHQIGQLLELGYAGLRTRFAFPIDSIEVSPAGEVSYREFRL